MAGQQFTGEACLADPRLPEQEDAAEPARGCPLELTVQDRQFEIPADELWTAPGPRFVADPVVSS